MLNDLLKTDKKRWSTQMKLVSTLFIFIFIIASEHAHPLTCKKLFASELDISKHRTEVQNIKDMIKYFEGYHDKFTHHKLTKATVDSKLTIIERMSQKIIMDNLPLLLIKYSNISNITARDIKLVSWAENESHYFNFGFKVKDHLIQTRSNGYVTFLDMSWQYRSKFTTRHYQMAYLKEGEIHTENQTHFLLSTLPEKLYLSRNMSQQEQTDWVSGKGYSGWRFGEKVHFAPHYFRFKNTEPYLVEFSRDELIEHRADDLFEINTYDAIVENYSSQKQRNNIIIPNKMNLELEIVYIGKDAIKTLIPKMKTQVAQGVLDLQIGN